MKTEFNVSINDIEYIIVVDLNNDCISIKKEDSSDEFDLFAFVNWEKVKSKFLNKKFPLKEVFAFLIDHNLKFDYSSENNELVIEFKNCDFWRLSTCDYQENIEITSSSGVFCTSDILYSLKKLYP